jgi:hypothetical protein
VSAGSFASDRSRSFRRVLGGSRISVIQEYQPGSLISWNKTLCYTGIRDSGKCRQHCNVRYEWAITAVSGGWAPLAWIIFGSAK